MGYNVEWKENGLQYRCTQAGDRLACGGADLTTKKKEDFDGVAEGGCYFLLFSAIFCYFGGLDFFYFLAVVWAFAKGRGNEGLLTPASPQNTYQRCRTTFFSSKNA